MAQPRPHNIYWHDIARDLVTGRSVRSDDKTLPVVCDLRLRLIRWFLQNRRAVPWRGDLTTTTTDTSTSAGSQRGGRSTRAPQRGCDAQAKCPYRTMVQVPPPASSKPPQTVLSMWKQVQSGREDSDSSCVIDLTEGAQMRTWTCAHCTYINTSSSSGEGRDHSGDSSSDDSESSEVDGQSTACTRRKCIICGQYTYEIRERLGGGGATDGMAMQRECGDAPTCSGVDPPVDRKKVYGDHRDRSGPADGHSVSASQRNGDDGKGDCKGDGDETENPNLGHECVRVKTEQVTKKENDTPCMHQHSHEELECKSELSVACSCVKRESLRPLPPQHFYQTVVSEIMCQQTQIATVIPYFHRWLNKLPSFQTVVESCGVQCSEQEDVKDFGHLKLSDTDINPLRPLWAGLGYYRRLKTLCEISLHMSARSPLRQLVQYSEKVRERYGRVLAGTNGALSAAGGTAVDELCDKPTCVKDLLLSLPGVGSYTAGAIGSLTCDWMLPAVDGNVIRVFSRFLGMEAVLGCAAKLSKNATWPWGPSTVFSAGMMRRWLLDVMHYSCDRMFGVRGDLGVPHEDARDGARKRPRSRRITVAQAWQFPPQLVGDIEDATLRSAANSTVFACSCGSCREARRLLSVGQPSSSFSAVITSSLMELGSLVCTKRNPKCGECPLRSQCRAIHQQCSKSKETIVKQEASASPPKHPENADHGNGLVRIHGRSGDSGGLRALSQCPLCFTVTMSRKAESKLRLKPPSKRSLSLEVWVGSVATNDVRAWLYVETKTKDYEPLRTADKKGQGRWLVGQRILPLEYQLVGHTSERKRGESETLRRVGQRMQRAWNGSDSGRADISFQSPKTVGNIVHKFSHLDLHLSVHWLVGSVDGTPLGAGESLWVPMSALQSLGLSSMFMKALGKVGEFHGKEFVDGEEGKRAMAETQAQLRANLP